MGTMFLAGLVFLAQLGQSPNETASKAGRVGIEISKRGGNLVVSAVSAGSSAETSGLKVGDEVLRVDVENETNKSAASAEADLRAAWRFTDHLWLIAVGQSLVHDGHEETLTEGTNQPSRVPRAFYGQLEWRP